MSDKTPVNKTPVNKPEPADPAKRRHAAREAHRAKALKANLRRRKAPKVETDPS